MFLGIGLAVGLTHFASNFVQRGRPRLGFRRRYERTRQFLQVQFEEQRTDLDLVAVLELLFVLNQGPIDQGAVTAGEVLEEDTRCVDPEQAVLPADHTAVGTDVALLPPAKVVIAGMKEHLFTKRGPLEDP